MNIDNKKLFIVVVRLSSLDNMGIECADLTDIPVAVKADNEEQAIMNGLLYQSDNGTVVKNDDLIWECREPERNVVWKLKRCLSVSQEEFDIFLTITQGISVAVYPGCDPSALYA
jgi:hypothetical protein